MINHVEKNLKIFLHIIHNILLPNINNNINYKLEIENLRINKLL